MKDLLRAQIQASYGGPNTSHPPLLEAVGGLSAAQAGWKPAPERHSIGQIVGHVRLCRLYWAEFLQGRELHLESAESAWPDPVGDDDAAWVRSVAALSEAHERLIQIIGNLSEEDLRRRPMPKIDANLLQILLWEIPTHDAYHIGQIRYLRALQGASEAAIPRVDVTETRRV